jgi:hypothetical protein
MRYRKRSGMLTLGMLSAALVVALSGTAAGAERPPNPPTGPEVATSSSARQPGQVAPLSPSQCGSLGWYCAWQNEGWSGSFWAWYQPVNQWFYVGSGANDQISSDWNRNQHGTWVARDYPAGTYQYCTSTGGSHEHMNTFPQPPYPYAGDSISAVYIANYGC